MKTADLTTLEPKMVALYESALEELPIGSGTRVLDVACGTGLFLRLAAQRGASVSGIDAAEMDSLPFEDDAFDVVTGFNAFQFAADPAQALREAGRVAVPGAPVLIAAWGRPEECEAAAYVQALGALLPAGVLEPFALSERGAIEAFAASGGLVPGERREVLCVWDFADDEALLRALDSTGPAAEAVLDAVAPFQTSSGGYRLENVFSYLVAHVAAEKGE